MGVVAVGGFVGPLAGGAGVQAAGCDTSVDVRTTVPATPVGGTFGATGVTVSNVDAGCAGDTVWVDAIDGSGAVVAGGSALAVSGGSVSMDFDSTVADANTIASYSVLIQRAALPSALTAAATYNSSDSFAFGVGVDDTYAYLANRNPATVLKFHKDIGLGADVVQTLSSGFGDRIGMHVPGDGFAYVANSGDGDVSKIAVDGSGAIKCWTVGDAVSGVTSDGSYFYVSTWTQGVLKFQPTCGTSPVAQIAGPATLIEHPREMSVHDGELFVAEPNGKVLVFDTSDSGNVAPKRAIFGGNTGFSYVTDAQVHDGYRWVVSHGASTISLFNLDDDGDVAPLRVFTTTTNPEIATIWAVEFAGDKVYMVTVGADWTQGRLRVATIT